MQHEQKEEDFSLKSYFIPLTTSKAIHFLVIIGLIVFFNGLFNNFVSDDNSQIISNPNIQSLKNFPRFFLDNRLDLGEKAALGASYYKPFLDTSFSFTYALFGPNFFAFHLFQVILAIVNACLLFLVLKRFFNKSVAFILSLVFLIHPINSEAALYIAATQEVLFFFFGILSLWILQNYQSQKAIILASLCLLASLFSKETGILFLCIALLYVFIYKRKFFYPFFGYSFLVFVIYFILRVHAIGFFVNTLFNAPIQKLDLFSRLINIPEVVLFYLKTFLFPLDLSSSYQWVYTQMDSNHFFLPLVIDLLFFAAVCSFAIILYKKYSRKMFVLYSFFLIWFIVGLLLHLQFFPLDQTVAERWFYFPIVGILGMIGVIVEAFHVNLKNKWILVVVGIIILMLSLRTFTRSFDYRNDFILASHDITVSNDSYNLEYIMSGLYYQQGRLKEAKVHGERSVQLFPYISNYTNLGAIYSSMGNYKKAKEAYMKATQYGEDSLPYKNLAALAMVYGDPKENIDFIKNVSLKKYPKDGMLWFTLAILEYTHGNKDDAKTEINEAKLYSKNPQVGFIYDIITNNKTLNLNVKNGQVTFSTM